MRKKVVAIAFLFVLVSAGGCASQVQLEIKSLDTDSQWRASGEPMSARRCQNQAYFIATRGPIYVDGTPHSYVARCVAPQESAVVEKGRMWGEK